MFPRILAKIGEKGFNSTLKSALWIAKNQGIMGLLAKFKTPSNPVAPSVDHTQEVLTFHTPSDEKLAAMKDEISFFPHRPTISIILPVFNTPINFLRAAIDSVIKQIYPNWELCIADDASSIYAVRELLNEYHQNDTRIKVVFRSLNGHISLSSNSALDLASGEFVALLDHDDELAPHALFSMVQAINRNPEADILYSNEDKIDAAGHRFEPAFKAAWSPVYFSSFQYTGHLAMYRHSLAKKIGGFRVGFEGSQDYDLGLRATEKARQVVHVPEILYHWRVNPGSVAGDLNAKPYAFEAGRKAISESYRRRNIPHAIVRESARRGIYRLELENAIFAPITVLVYGSEANKKLESIVNATYHPGAVFHCYDSEVFPQEWIRKAAAESALPLVALVNANCIPHDSNWLTSLISYSTAFDAGAVAPKLVDPQRSTIVHAGYTLMGTRIGANFFGLPETHPGYAGRLIAAHSTSALSSLCMVVKKELLLSSFVSHPFQSQLAFDIALSCEARQQSLPLIVFPLTTVTCPAPQEETSVTTLQDNADLELLNERYNLSQFIDPMYPPALDSVKLDFSPVW